VSDTRPGADTLATLLICGGLGGREPTPLSRAEWNSLVRQLIRAGWRPGDLPRRGMTEAQSALGLEPDFADRLTALLGQAVLVAAELERLTRAGIGVLSRADDTYPARWRARLRDLSPPLLFVAGNLALLKRGGIAAVGSRKVDEAGAAFGRRIGRAAARAGMPLISGGARGVDREAMFGALGADGEAIGILPDSLARSLRAPDVRQAVAAGQLLLVSPNRPAAKFEIWRAMDRNRLIYALADLAVVVSSDAGSGGTWAGATENMRHDWTPLFVRAGDDVPEGNRRLIALGALPLSSDDLQLGRDDDLVVALFDRAARVARQEPLLASAPARLMPRDDPGVTAAPSDEEAHGSPSPAAGQLPLGEGF
jgi:predicted Rossmann fold nucleotide-binding protein DprA/Smf involved in DNA uptake